MAFVLDLDHPGPWVSWYVGNARHRAQAFYRTNQKGSLLHVCHINAPQYSESLRIELESDGFSLEEKLLPVKLDQLVLQVLENLTDRCLADLSLKELIYLLLYQLPLR